MPSWYWLIISSGLLGLSCQSRDPYQDLVRGTIAYPFVERTTPLGENGREEKFVIRTVAGNSEYIVEIPHAAQDYDVEVPIAQIKPEGDIPGESKVKTPQITDRELVGNLPRLSEATQEERALLDRAFGVGEDGGPRQSPSYVMGLAKINQLYREHKYEFALIEINNMLSFYPTSNKLHKMKGTVLIKVNNLRLAEKSWLRALELDPADPVLKKGLERLRNRITLNEQAALRGNTRKAIPAVQQQPGGDNSEAQPAGFGP